MQEPPIIFGEPSFDGAEEDLVLEVLRSRWIGQGPMVERFEHELGEYLGVAHVVTTSSCTSALQLSMLALGIGPGDEVITTPFTFVATINAIELVGATPVLVDIDETTLNIDPELVDAAITRRTRAILPVHFAGLPVDLSALSEIAERSGIWIIEDAAHAIGASLDGRRIGNSAYDRSVACFSFYPNKNLASAEGGAVSTNDSQLATRLRTMRQHGLDTHAWNRRESSSNVERHRQAVAVMAGLKCNWTDLQAAIAIPQLAKLEGFIEHRHRVAVRYHDHFSSFEGIRPMTSSVTATDVRHAMHLYQVAVDPSIRDEVLDYVVTRRIGVGTHYVSAHLHPFFENLATRPMPVAEWASRALVSLPLHPGVSMSDADRVATVMREAVGHASSRAASSIIASA